MTDFNSIYGNELVVRNLKNACMYNRVAHCYMITGEKGLGKKTIAKAFAKSIQCECGNEPCGKCSSCIQVENEDHPDVIYVRHEKPNTFSVDDIRDGLNRSIMIKPYKSEKKIYILEDGELLNQQAQNAMLKTIEEPPEYGVIIILTENSEAFLPTIKSRCVELNMGYVSNEQIKACLIGRGVDASRINDEVLSFAAGNIGKAILYLEDDAYQKLVWTVKDVFYRICDADSVELHDAVERLSVYKDNIRWVIELLRRMFTDMFLCKSGAKALVGEEEGDKLMRLAEHYSYSDLPRIISQTELFMARQKVNVNIELSLELMLMELKPGKV